MSLKMKLTSAIIMFMLAIATLVIGVLAAQTQSINMEGTINFEISDRSLYVKNVRLEDSDGTTTEITSFMPGYINDGITLSLGTHTVSNTSFKIHFDLINTTSNTYEAGDVTLSQELQSANVIASASGTISPTTEDIPDGESYAPITSTTPISGTITLFINSPNTTSIDLNGISVEVKEYVPPRNFSEEGFVINGNTITDYTGNASSIILPSRYVINEEGDYLEDLDGTGTQITIIGSYAFSYSDLTTVIIPEGIEEIQTEAFAYSQLLTEVTIPSTMSTIYSAGGRDAPFVSCYALAIVYNNSSIDIESGMGLYENGSIAYSAKEVVNSGETPQGLVAINDQIQYYVNEYTGEKIALASAVAKTNLTSVTLDSDTTEINQNAFSYCTSLQSVDFNNCQITSIPESAFRSCSSLTTITIPESVTSIGSGAFSFCASLTTITILENVTSIGSGAFSECTSFTTITIPEGVTSIGDGAFSNCTSLTTITIPEGVTSIGDGAFTGCTNLQYNTDGEGMYLGSATNPYFALIDTQRTTSTSITINSNCKVIAGDAFYGCSSLTTITIPEGVTSIGDGAFSNCSSLTTITIPETVTSIGDYAFSGCTSLTTITIPEAVETIRNYAFSGCTNLQYNNDGEGMYLGSETNLYFALIDTQTTTFTSITIHPNCKIIAGSAFDNCRSLTTITIPESVTSIGSQAFQSCSSLQTVDFGTNSSLQTIGDSAFNNCSSLTTITIPDSVETIGSNAFSYCSSLTTVVIESQYAYNNATSISACGYLLNRAQTVKVLSTVVEAGTNSYLTNTSNFPYTWPEGDYKVFSKNPQS